jgi:hypothetical protein
MTADNKPLTKAQRQYLEEISRRGVPPGFGLSHHDGRSGTDIRVLDSLVAAGLVEHDGKCGFRLTPTGEIHMGRSPNNKTSRRAASALFDVLENAKSLQARSVSDRWREYTLNKAAAAKLAEARAALEEAHRLALQECE